MVMTSTVMLHALPPFSAALCNFNTLPTFSLHAAATTTATPLHCRASTTLPYSIQPKSLTFGSPTQGLLSTNPRRVRREPVEELPGRKVRYRSVTASSSAMADVGICTGPPPMYRANVGICLINQNNQVFVAQRLDIPEAWQMPQGGIDQEEDPRAAAFRELREETGVTSAEYLGEVPEWLTYDFPPDVKARLSTFWGSEFNGQAQKWFLFRFTGNDSEINLLNDGSEAPEFCEWKWVPVEAVSKNAVEFKKRVYERVFQHLGKLIN